MLRKRLKTEPITYLVAHLNEVQYQLSQTSLSNNDSLTQFV